MTLKNLLTLCITFSLFASSQLEASGPSTVEDELAKVTITVFRNVFNRFW